MRIVAHRILLLTIILLSAFCASTLAQTVTLHPPHDPDTKIYNEGNACYSFKYAALKRTTRNDWDLGYGFLAINHHDWFTVNISNEKRSVIKDLGKLEWGDHFEIPVLEPLPVLPPGQHRKITIDTSGDKPLSKKERQEQEKARRTGSDDPFEAVFKVETPQNPLHDYEPAAPLPRSKSAGAEWPKPDNIFAKVAPGHIYLLRVKNQVDDFYVLFRVEDFEQQKYCRISWRFASPAEDERNR